MNHKKMDKSKELPGNSGNEIVCAFLIAKGQIFISVDSLQSAYTTMIDRSDIIIDVSRKSLEAQGMIINSSFSDGFKSCLACLSNVIRDQTNALNVSIETEDLGDPV